MRSLEVGRSHHVADEQLRLPTRGRLSFVTSVIERERVFEAADAHRSDVREYQPQRSAIGEHSAWAGALRDHGQRHAPDSRRIGPIVRRGPCVQTNHSLIRLEGERSEWFPSPAEGHHVALCVAELETRATRDGARPMSSIENDDRIRRVSGRTFTAVDRRAEPRRMTAAQLCHWDERPVRRWRDGSCDRRARRTRRSGTARDRGRPDEDRDRRPPEAHENDHGSALIRLSTRERRSTSGTPSAVRAGASSETVPV
jgi:hypothetical protein